MARSTIHYADSATNNVLKSLHNKLRSSGTPVERVEYIIELLILRIFETKLRKDDAFVEIRKLFEKEGYKYLFSYLHTLSGEQILEHLNKNIFPFYGSILSKASQVVTSNLNQKVQDQLVLIEEIFSKSKFTENILSGKLYEVISLINELDEERILNTDILGDAIESALSETGGTKDIGLNRTPDHIRHMMVAMCEPEYKDTIFDPACGTGGFLFDSFQYVIEKTTRNGNWPSKNAHKEIQQFFIEYFKNNKLKIPTIPESNQFYRSGVGGIEYMGRIRKMAAINLYIRGLNPANILQGDSLHLYKPEVYENSKTCIIANPPFGAEKDQEAYPNVWDEYSKEGETTILFVKMMLDTLAPGGRCAVIVSEGFLTWGQNSARTLRHKLLTEANLKAVISLPQGLFVSKSGQGAKTSLLYFEKGTPTKNVWFYKMTNDGFALGVNRKEQVNSQIPEILNIFLSKVKKGETPENTLNSFSVPASWILEIDPRIKERIAQDKKSEIEEKELSKMNEIKDKDKKKEKLIALESKIRNEIAKEIEKKHVYSYNMATYRSSLSADQLKKWNNEIKLEKTEKSIDDRYTILKSITDKNEKVTLSLFDITRSLELDMVREYLAKIQAKSKLAQNLLDIAKEENKIGLVPLRDMLIPKKENIKLEDEVLYKQITIKLYGKGLLLRQEILGQDIKTEQQFIVSAGDFIMSKIDARNGAFGIVPDYLNNAVVTSSFPYFTVNTELAIPEYIEAIVTQKSFYDKINNVVAGATGRRSVGEDDFLDLEIPLPPLEKQAEIVAEVSRLNKLIKGCGEIKDNISIPKIFAGRDSNLEDISKLIGTGSTPSRENKDYFNGNVNWTLTTEVCENEIFSTTEHLSELAVKDFGLRIYPVDTILIAMYGQGQTRGRTALLKIDSAITQNCAGIIIDEKKAISKYVWYFLRSIYLKIRSQDYTGGGVPHLNLQIVKSIKVPIPGIEIQKEIVKKIDKHMEVSESVRQIMSDSETEIKSILVKIWGENKLTDIK
jgi:type I restriction-modification system DNA methylase subunit